METLVVNMALENAELWWQVQEGFNIVRGAPDFSIICASNIDGKKLVAFNECGKHLWSIDIPDIIADFKIATDGRWIVLSTMEGTLYYIEKSGRVTWHKKVGDNIPLLSISGNGAIISAYVISEDMNTLHIIARGGQMIARHTIPSELISMALSYDGSVILAGDAGRNIYQFTKTGECAWSRKMDKMVKQIAVSQSGLFIVIVTNVLQAISPFGKDRWILELPEGMMDGVEVSSDAFVNAGISLRLKKIFRFDMSGKLLWKHVFEEDVDKLMLTYRGHQVLLVSKGGIMYWDKYGYDILSVPLPQEENIREGNILVSQDGRYIVYINPLGYINCLDVGKSLARHLIEASEIFYKELQRVGGNAPQAEENLQWSLEAEREGDTQYALIYGYQTYNLLEGTLDSIPIHMEGGVITSIEAKELYRKVMSIVYDGTSPTQREIDVLRTIKNELKLKSEEGLEISKTVVSEEKTPSLLETKAFDMDSYVASLLSKHIKKK